MLARVVATVGVVVVVAAGSAAAEPMVAIAPVPIGTRAPAELQRAMAEELPGALVAAGFSVKEPKEVDLKVAERPELMRCTSGACLADEAAFLQVERLALPRLEPAADRQSFTVAITLYDVSTRRSVAAVERCGGPGQPCTDPSLRVFVRTEAQKLFSLVAPPGTLDVRAQPAARCSVDGQTVGTTPWHGEVSAGDHVVVLEAGGARVQRDVHIEPGRPALVDVSIDVPHPRARSRFYAVKWVTLAAGLAAGSAGGALWGIDGSGTCNLSGTQRECPKLFDTLPAGAALVGVGGALLVTSIVMLALDKPRRSSSLGAVVAPMPGGAALAVEGAF